MRSRRLRHRRYETPWTTPPVYGPLVIHAARADSEPEVPPPPQPPYDPAA